MFCGISLIKLQSNLSIFRGMAQLLECKLLFKSFLDQSFVY